MVTTDPPVQQGQSTAFKRGYAKLLAALLIACVPFGVFIIAAGLHVKSLGQPVRGGVTTTGVVVGYQQTTKDSVPIVAFTTPSGRRVTFTAAETLDRPQLGQRVVVSYRPDDPAGAHDLSEPGNSGVAAVIMGLALCALGGWFCWRIGKARLTSRSA